ncbi:hypothetical protein Ddc_20087 [Ditylenchus destructor]|nr:hypothetical protein Ddc_20087 [Ditylenchus destructor]
MAWSTRPPPVGRQHAQHRAQREREHRGGQRHPHHRAAAGQQARPDVVAPGSRAPAARRSSARRSVATRPRRTGVCDSASRQKPREAEAGDDVLIGRTSDGSGRGPGAGPDAGPARGGGGMRPAVRRRGGGQHGGQVGGQVDGHDAHGDDQHDGLDHGHVAHLDGGVERVADAGIAEDHLGDQRTAEEHAQRHRHALDGGDQGVGQRMPPDDAALGDPSQPGSDDVVGLQHLDHGCPHQAQQIGRDGQGQRRGGQHEVTPLGQQAAVGLQQGGRRQDLEHRGREDQHQQDRDGEAGHRLEQHQDGERPAVAPGCPGAAPPYPPHQRQRQSREHDAGREQQRVGEARPHQLTHRHVGVDRSPQSPDSIWPAQCKYWTGWADPIGAPGREAGAVRGHAADAGGHGVQHVGESPDQQAAALVLDLLRLMDQRGALVQVGLGQGLGDELGEAGIVEVGLVARGARSVVLLDGQQEGTRHAATGAEGPARAVGPVEGGGVDLLDRHRHAGLLGLLRKKTRAALDPGVTSSTSSPSAWPAWASSRRASARSRWRCGIAWL